MSDDVTSETRPSEQEERELAALASLWLSAAHRTEAWDSAEASGNAVVDRRPSWITDEEAATRREAWFAALNGRIADERADAARQERGRLRQVVEGWTPYETRDIGRAFLADSVLDLLDEEET